jgi:hypothetical protein
LIFQNLPSNLSDLQRESWHEAAGKNHPAVTEWESRGRFPLVALFAGGNEAAVRKKRLGDFFPIY